MLGFNLEVAEFGAAKVGYRSIEEAVGYLTDKDDVTGFYVHEYVPFKNEECYICQRPQSEHRRHIEEEIKSFDEENDSASNNRNEVIVSQDRIRNNAQRITESLGLHFAKVIEDAKNKCCLICYEEKPGDQFFGTLQGECDHNFCLECTQE